MKRRSPARIKRRSSRRHVSQTPRMKRTKVRSPKYDDTPLSGKNFYRQEFTRQQELVNAIQRSMYRQEHLPDSARVYDGAKGEFEPQQPLLLPTRDGRRQDVHTLDTSAVCSGHTDCISFQGDIADFMDLKPVSNRERDKIILQLNSGDASYFPERGVLCFKVDAPRNANHAFCVYFEVDTVYIIQSYVREQIPLVTKMSLQLFCDHLWNLLFGDNWNKSYSKLFRVRLSPKGVYKAGSVKLDQILVGRRQPRVVGAGVPKLSNPKDIEAYMKKDVETCGYLRPSASGHYKAVVRGEDSVGKGDRAACTYKPPYEELLWHTHPNGIKAYPSAEDVLKVLKKRSSKHMIQKSFIYTMWGVWELYATKKTDIPKKHEKELVKTIDNKYSRRMYNATKRGRATHLTEKMHLAIEEYIDYLENKFSDNGLQINLYSK